MTIDELYRMKIDRIEKRIEQIFEIVKAGPAVPKITSKSIFNNIEVESFLEVSRSTLYRWRKKRNLKLPKMGAQLIYNPEHIVQLVDRPKTTRRKKTPGKPDSK